MSHPEANATNTAEAAFAKIRVDSVRPNAHNPRRRRNEKAADIKESIRRVGLLQPLTVRRIADGQFEVVGGGNTRLAALQELAKEEGGERFEWMEARIKPDRPARNSADDDVLQHFAENEIRGEMSFHDKAVALAAIASAFANERGRNPSLVEMTEMMKSRGLPMSSAYASYLRFAADTLFSWAVAPRLTLADAKKLMPWANAAQTVAYEILGEGARNAVFDVSASDLAAGPMDEKISAAEIDDFKRAVTENIQRIAATRFAHNAPTLAHIEDSLARIARPRKQPAAAVLAADTPAARGSQPARLGDSFLAAAQIANGLFALKKGGPAGFIVGGKPKAGDDRQSARWWLLAAASRQFEVDRCRRFAEQNPRDEAIKKWLTAVENKEAPAHDEAPSAAAFIELIQAAGLDDAELESYAWLLCGNARHNG